MANPWDKPTATAQGNPWDRPSAPAQEAASAPQGNPGFFGPIQDAYDDAVKPTMGANKLDTAAGDFGRGVLDLAEPIMHPVKTGMAMMPHSAGELAQDVMTPGSRQLGMMGEGVAKDFKDNGWQRAIPHIAGSIVGGVIAGKAPGMASDAASAMSEAAMGDPNAAALRGLQIGPRSDSQLSTIRSIEKSRPYLKGATSQADMQEHLPGAMNEVWSPYKQAVEAIGDRPVKFDGIESTIRELEAERSRLSALNRGVKSGNPSDIQQVMQEGRTPAQNIEREAAVKAVIDPHLASTGINPNLIRDTYGSLADVRSGVEGKTTLNEKPAPSGVGRMMNMRLTEPKTLIGEPLQGARDVIAGRPLWSAKPTDLGIKEGFRMGGAKPGLGDVRTTNNPPPPARLLSAPAREMPAPAYDGRVEGYRPPPVDAGTTPMRTGKLLPSQTGHPDLPMSSYHQIFPEQLPNSRLTSLLKELEKR